MSEFQLYYGLGFDHILDINGYDHILFVVVLCALYQPRDWKKLLVLVTSFTVGHSVTLALATLDLIQFDSALIERLIPVTILFTAISNLVLKTSRVENGKVKRNFIYAGFFGLIHGMGFSNYLKALMNEGESIVWQLFAFNVGLEIGQLIIVAIFMAVSYLFVSIAGVSKRDWKIIISSAIGGVATLLLLNTIT